MQLDLISKVIADSIPDFLIMLSPKLKITFFNENIASLYGWSKERMTGKEFFRQFEKKPNFCPVKMQEIKLVLKKHRVVERQQILTVNDTNEAKTKKIIHWKINEIRNERKDLLGVMIIGIDQTAVAKLDEEKRSVSNYLRNIMEHIPGYVFWKDRNSVLLGCNANFAKIAGQTMDSIVGKTDYDLPWTRAETEHFIADDREVIESGQPKLNIEEPMRYTDGTEAYLLTHKMPLRNAKNEIIGVIGIFTDITERKKTELALRKAKEEAEASNKAKTQFLENMRHDIRTPVTAMVGFADIIKNLSKDRSIKDYAEHLVESGQALLDFLNEVLETVQVASGEVPLLKKKFDLKTKLMSVIQLNQVTAKEKNLKLTFDFDKKIPHYLVGDPKRVYRIVLELVTNAINFTEKGFVKVSVKLARSLEHERVVEISVQDSGMGIPEEKQKDIYVRFNRLTPSYEGIYKGIGVGLSIAKQFVDDLSGEIYLKSKPNKGSTFRCLIPFKEALLEDASGVDLEEEVMPKLTSVRKSASYKTVRQKQMPAKKIDLTKSKILLVEDNASVGLGEKVMLEELACQVDWAKNGEQALKLFEQNRYELVLMDIGLPDITGYEVTKRMRVLEWNRDKAVPIIALSAHTEAKDQRQQCVDGGMNAVLTKPAEKEKMEHVLNALVPSRASKSSSQSAGAGLSELAQQLNRSVPTEKAQQVEEKDLLNITAKIFDIEATAKKIGLKREMIAKMIGMFLDSLNNEDLPAMAKAYENIDWKTVQELAHKIKGGALYCGAMRVKEASSRLEAYLMSGKTEMGHALYQQLLKEIDTMKVAAKEKEAA